MEQVGERDRVVEGVRRARERVTGALVALQETDASGPDGDELFAVAEVVARASGLLFQLQRAPAGARASEDLEVARDLLVRAQDRLQRALRPAEGVTRTVESLSGALAVLTELAPFDLRDAGAAGVGRDAGRGSGSGTRRKLLLLAEEDEEASVAMTQSASRNAQHDRRAAERVLLHVDLGLTSESNFYAGLTMDVSEGGLFIATYDRLPVGTLVSLEFALPNGHEVKADGAVCWLRDSRVDDLVPGMGIAFDGLQSEDLDAIRRFCRTRAPLYIDVD